LKLLERERKSLVRDDFVGGPALVFLLAYVG
jgi:hypothetical protein